MATLTTRRKSSEIDEFFLAEVSGGTSCDQHDIVEWEEREGRPGETLIDALTRAGLLVPTARRVIESSWVCALHLPPTRALFTRAGVGWFGSHFPSRRLPDSASGGHAAPLRETVTGVRLTGATLTEPLPSDQLAGPPLLTAGWYRLHEVIGRGQVGEVYLGESVFGGDPGAIKLIPTTGQTGLAERFLNGAAVARHLGLAGCAAVRSAGLEFDHAFLIYPVVADGSIRTRHDSRHLSPAEATGWCTQAARVLADIHSAGFAHGNVKAGNLLVGPSGIALSDLSLPDEALTPRSSAVVQLQREDVTALVGVYTLLLGGNTDDFPGPCRELARKKHPTATTLADAFDEAADALSARKTHGTRNTSRILSPLTRTVEIPGSAPRVPYPGDLLGKCLLTEKVGEGATGVVFRATHQTLAIDVAVKVLSSVTQCNQELADQFAAEARILARLNHPNVVRIWDFEARSEYPPYLVLEFIDGETLDDRIRRRGALPADEAVPLFAQIIDGLAAAHTQAGLVHRDIKPANILLGVDGAVKVADLGLGSILDTEAQLTTRVAGTPAYMAPEQVNGAKAADLRSDIYALGVTLYHAVTGQMPFTGKSRMQVIFKHINEAPVPPNERAPSLSQSLSATILKMMAKRPEDRFQTSDELLDALAGPASPPADSSPPTASGVAKKSSVLRRLFTR